MDFWHRKSNIRILKHVVYVQYVRELNLFIISNVESGLGEYLDTEFTVAESGEVFTQLYHSQKYTKTLNSSSWAPGAFNCCKPLSLYYETTTNQTDQAVENNRVSTFQAISDRSGHIEKAERSVGHKNMYH